MPLGALPPADPERAEQWDSDAVVADLFIMTPTGVFIDRCPQSEREYRGGTWHTPDSCPH